MRTIIAGSRDIFDVDLVRQAVKNCTWPITEVVSGKARGIDTCGELVANELGIPIKPFPVSKEDWEYYGMNAGKIRNGDMAEYAEALILIHNGSGGSLDMLKKAKRKFKQYIIEIDVREGVNVLDFE